MKHKQSGLEFKYELPDLTMKILSSSGVINLSEIDIN